MARESLLPYPQQPYTCPFPMLDELVTLAHPLSLGKIVIVMLSVPLCFCSQCVQGLSTGWVKKCLMIF